MLGPFISFEVRLPFGHGLGVLVGLIPAGTGIEVIVAAGVVSRIWHGSLLESLV
jgi:hypothetical protein